MFLKCGAGEDSWESLGLQVHPQGDQSWIFIRRADAEAETPILWPPDAKSWLIGKDPDSGKDWGQEEKGMTKDKMVGWHLWLDGYEFEQAPGIGDRQGSVLQSMGCKESDMTEQLNWTEVSISQGFATCRCNVITWEMCYLHTHLLNICLTCTWVSGTLLSAGDTTAR